MKSNMKYFLIPAAALAVLSLSCEKTILGWMSQRKINGVITTEVPS